MGECRAERTKERGVGVRYISGGGVASEHAGRQARCLPVGDASHVWPGQAGLTPAHRLTRAGLNERGSIERTTQALGDSPTRKRFAGVQYVPLTRTYRRSGVGKILWMCWMLAIAIEKVIDGELN